MSQTKVGEPGAAAYDTDARDPTPELSRLADELYREAFLRPVGKTTPESFQALLASRGVIMEVGELLRSAMAVVIDLPKVGPAAAGQVLTDAEVAVLSEGGFETDLQQEGDDPLALGIGRFASLIAASLTTAGAARRVGVNSSRIRQRLKARTIYGFKHGRGWRIPAFQFSGRILVPGIDQAIKALPADLHPVAVATWFTIPNPDLVDKTAEEPVTPLEWLGAGRDSDTVAALAADL